MDVTPIEKDWRARGFSFSAWTDDPGQRWEGYVHEYGELFMVLDCEVELEMHEERWHPTPGYEVLIPANRRAFRSQPRAHSSAVVLPLSRRRTGL
jgi:hypothetical protein